MVFTLLSRYYLNFVRESMGPFKNPVAFMINMLIFSVNDEPFTPSSFPLMDFYVNHTGGVWWSMPLVVRTFCRIDVANYPFDTQKCHIVVGY